MTIDQDKLGEFLGRFVADLGATLSAPLVVIGDRLGTAPRHPQPAPPSPPGGGFDTTGRDPY